MDELIDKNLKILFESNNNMPDISIFKNKNESRVMQHEGFTIAQLLYDEDLILPIQGEYINISTNGFNISKNGGWLKHLENKKENLSNTVINADNLIIGDNYGNQSSKSHLYNPTIENDIVKPINKASEIWSFKNIIFAITTGLIVSGIIYIISNI